jgi:thymidine kinase
MFKLYSGAMKSGKSSHLLDDIYTSLDNFENILVLNSSKGFRNTNEVTSRDGKKHSAIGIKSFIDIIDLIKDSDGVQKVYLDEVQFLPNNLDEIIRVVEFTTALNIDLIISGLELNCFGKPFDIMGNLFCYADEVTKFKGDCDICNDNETNRVLRYRNSKVCNNCFIKEMRGTN